MARKKMPDLGAGAEVRRLRLAAGLTQADVAAACEVGASYVAQIEVGARTGWNPDLLYKLSRVLGVECDHWRPYFDPAPTDLPPPPPAPPAPRGRPRKPPA